VKEMMCPVTTGVQAYPETSSISPIPHEIGITENSILMWAMF